MLKTIVLICAASLDHSACNVDNALDVIRIPATKNAVMCGLSAQVTMAQTSLAPELGKSYQKIVCVREREAAR